MRTFCKVTLSRQGDTPQKTALGVRRSSDDETPYWRHLKTNGELNTKYPNGVEAQKEKLEAEGHSAVNISSDVID